MKAKCKIVKMYNCQDAISAVFWGTVGFAATTRSLLKPNISVEGSFVIVKTNKYQKENKTKKRKQKKITKAHSLTMK